MSTPHPPAPPSRAWDYGELRRLLTNERLSSYFADTDGSNQRAFELYEWNMSASASVLELTSMVEVIIRNAIDAALAEWAQKKHPGISWFDLAPLDGRASLDVSKARQRATRYGKDAEIHGKVIAELNLGFWRFLVESRYLTSLWVPATHRAFENGPKDLWQRQREVAGRMKGLTFVRNRAAHHEPIHRRNLQRDLTSALDLAKWVSADAEAWVNAKSTLRQRIPEHPGRRKA